MKHILIFAGIAAAIALYLTRKDKGVNTGSHYITDAEIEAYDIKENSGELVPVV